MKKYIRRFLAVVVFIEAVSMIINGKGLGVFCFLFIASSLTTIYAELTEMEELSTFGLLASLFLMYVCSAHVWASPLVLIIALVLTLGTKNLTI